MVDLIREFRPHLVVTHHASGDIVPDHSETGRAVLHACHCAGRPGFESSLPVHIVKDLFVWGLGISERAQRLTGSPSVLPELYIDISDMIEKKINAMVAFVSQQYTPEMIKRRMEVFEGHYGMESGTSYAEPFFNTKPILLEELPIYKGVVNYGRKINGSSTEQ
jgi:LmbE family N-acetylglucosaminyl deacetylase